ncbi:SpoIIE family protein phosphatase [Sulfurovum sp.]|uniref:SpoIIE family protein phosphatase n=1 Tax=Sulfurovum sp. TaxID=1969726 RepID=UPI0025DDC81E|nr:SpoIIE family protein phosphatase [Sulfurovum sp.]
MAKVFTNLRFKLDRIQKKVIVYIVVITLPLLFSSLYFIQDSVGSELAKSAKQEASRIEATIIAEIENYLDDASSFTKEASCMLKLHPREYTTVLPFLKQHIEKNPNVYGSALAIEPSSSLHKIYCRYYYEDNTTVKSKWLMPPAYDYLQKDWYIKAKQSKKAEWSKPYFDEGGGEVFMSTFSQPLTDRYNHFLGVVTVDIKIDVLSRKIQKMTFSKEHFVFILDKNGFLLSHPDQNYALKQTVSAYAEDTHSETLLKTIPYILRTNSGVHTVKMDGKEFTLYFSTMSYSDLKILIFLRNTVLYKSLYSLKQKLVIIALIDIFLILLMIFFILQQFKKEIVKKTKLKNDLELARKIQESFLPKRSDVIEKHFEIHTYFKAAKKIGGDLYGYKEQDNSIVFYIGDVSGKGIPAALFMMATQILLTDTLDATDDPAQVITETNKKLLTMSDNGMFVTLLVIKYDFTAHTLTFCNAGHPNFILKTDYLFSPLATIHPPINTFGNAVYTNNTLTLKDPFQLICFSDGVTEAENSRQELFGIERVSKSLDREFGLKYLLEDIGIFIKNNAPNDDITILAYSIKF